MSPHKTTIRVADGETIKQFKNDFPCPDYLFPLLLRKADGGVFGFGKEGQAGDHIEFVEVDLDTKVQIEIGHWLSALRRHDDCLRTVSVALHDLVRRGHPDAPVILGRTARMLLLLRALLLRPKVSDKGLPGAAAELLTAAGGGLQQALDRLGMQHIPLLATPGGGWWTSPLLLLIVAIGQSHSRWFRPHRWEAFSAVTARQDIERKWPQLPSALVRLIAFLIQNQSAPGQLVRGTGSRKHLEIAKELADSSESRYTPETIEDMLNVLGVLEEARNRKLPGLEDDADLKWANAEIERDWDATMMPLGGLVPDGFPVLLPGDMATGIFSSNHDAIDTPTWGFPKYVGLGLEDFNAFKKQVQDKAEEQGYSEGGQFFLSYSFSRSQIADRVRKVLTDHAKAVIAGEVFSDHFRLEPREIPCAFDREYKVQERTVEVLLLDHLAAAAMVLPSGSPAPVHPRDKTAGALFASLFASANEAFGYQTHALRSDRLHVPVPVVRRLLKAVSQLRPSTIGYVSVAADGLPPASIPIPLGLREGEDDEAIHCVANYVWAYVLNLGMSKLSFTSCSLGFDGLLSGPDLPKESLSPEGWRARIEDCRTRLNYDILLENYLPLSNRAGRCVKVVPSRPPSTLEKIPVQDLSGALKRYFGLPDRSNALFVGVDVGGTFTKVCAYDVGETGLKPIGTSSQFMTPVFASGAKDPPEAFAADLVQGVLRYVKGVLRHLTSLGRQGEVKGVGFAWPGPVCDGRVVGSSAILGNLGLPHRVSESTMEVLSRVDILGRLKRAWPGEPESKPQFALINDGDAEGVGVLFDRAMRGERLDGLLVIVKLGTGCAGSVFRDGRLHGGLTEWGKLVINLSPRVESFPPGVNEILSAKALPALIKKGPRDLFFQDVTPNWDSRELGMLLDQKFDDLGWFHALCLECGLRAYAARVACPPGLVDGFRQILAESKAVDPGLLREVQKYLGVLGQNDAAVKLRREGWIYGSLRLEQMIGLLGERFKSLLPQGDLLGMHDEQLRLIVVSSPEPSPRVSPPPVPDDIQRKFNEAGERVKTAARTLGVYLGDLILELHDLYKQEGEPKVILSGGVLSDETGRVVRAAAAERAKKYDLRPALSGTGPTADAGGFAMLGAAAFAAGEYLFDRKCAGLNEIQRRVASLGLGEALNVTENAIIVRPENCPETIELAKYALDTKRDVIPFLDAQASSGLYCTQVYTPARPAVYTRWAFGEDSQT